MKYFLLDNNYMGYELHSFNTEEELTNSILAIVDEMRDNGENVDYMLPKRLTIIHGNEIELKVQTSYSLTLG